ncbi:DUF3373 domain-containing protein [Ferrimonas aestuarii]|uniref:DUF3373 domain-containing protein n=2 Tax=Ferrimonas aestuarii TaxID=2569539 RepID=A0A4U1BNG4_9GAMM|nr:DUF3373 domain-containing protein [Ferrimonas aestuarii]
MMKPTALALIISQVLIWPQAMAQDTSSDVDTLKRQLAELMEEVEYLSERVDRPETHAATDRVAITGDFRTKVHSLHYQDVSWGPGMTVQTPDGQRMAMSMFGPGVKPMPKDIDNDLFYTTRLRLNIKAKVWDNVNFTGRLTMFKNWGDSTEVNVFDSWNSFTQDGTSSGHPNGDTLRVERAYFDWKNIGGSHAYLSIGRRPSSYGYPTNLRENELRGGTPSGHLVNFNFDGVTLGYKLGEITGIDGQVLRFCYGQGYESEWGNGEMFGNIETDDTHLGGFNIDLLDDGSNVLQMTLFAAMDVADGFKGTMAMPQELIDIMMPGMQVPSNVNFVTRYQPSTNIGDIYLGGLTFVREEDNGLKWFTSLGWTRTDPNGNVGMFGGMNSDPLYAMNPDGTVDMSPIGSTDNEAHDAWSIYTGIQLPIADNQKLGLEYNYGSKYWTPFTQAQDDPIGSKLATRGHAFEAYYIYEVNPRMFIKVAGLYYDFDYSGSGSPVGAPQNIDEVIDGQAFSMMPVVDTAWDANASITLKF